MTDTKKPKLSEIRARVDALHGPPSHHVTTQFEEHAYNDIPYLLDLVKRLGKIIDGLVFRYHCDHHGDLEDCHFHKCKEARVLLKELEL